MIKHANQRDQFGSFLGANPPTIWRYLFLSLMWLTIEASAQPRSPLGEPARNTPPVAIDPALNEPVNLEDVIYTALELLDLIEPQAAQDVPQDQLDEVQGYLDILQTQASDHPMLPLIRGRFLALSGRPGAAVDLLMQFVETREGRNEWRAYRTLGNLFLDRYVRLAKSNYRRAALLNPQEPSIAYGLSLTAAKSGQVAEALTKAKEACEADGWRSIRYITHLALLHLNTGQWTDALREAHRSLELAAQLADSNLSSKRDLNTLDRQYQLLIEIHNGRIKESTVGDAEDYLALTKYIRARATILQNLANLEILEMLEKAIAEAGGQPDIPLMMEYGATLVALERTTEALHTFEQLLIRAPANTQIVEWIARLRADAP